MVGENRSAGHASAEGGLAIGRAYERLKRYAENVKGSLFDQPELHRSIEEICRCPLTQSAIDRINTHLRTDGKIPAYRLQRKIEQEVTKQIQGHVIIFT